jgi:hypothetical protein
MSPVRYVLLTRLPCYYAPEGALRIRLACVKHAASVRSEPGSNSPLDLYSLAIHPTTPGRRTACLCLGSLKNPRGYIFLTSTSQRTMYFVCLHKRSNLD